MRKAERFRQLRAAQLCRLPQTAEEIGGLALWSGLLGACWRTALRVALWLGLALGTLTFAATALLDRQPLTWPVEGGVTWLVLCLVHVVLAAAAGLALATGLALLMTLRGQLWHKRYLPAPLAGAVATLWVWGLGLIAWRQVRGHAPAPSQWREYVVLVVAFVLGLWVGYVLRRTIALVRTRRLPPPLAPRVRIGRTLLHAAALIVAVVLAGWWVSARHVSGFPRHAERVAEVLRVAPDRHVIVLGIDGLGWDEARVGIGDGSLTNWDAIERTGGRGRLRSSGGHGPAAFWLTAATGADALDHGVLGVTQPEVAWTRHPLAIAPEHAGLYQIYTRLLPTLGLAAAQPVSRQSVRRWCAWEMVRQTGGEAGVIGWWGAWPGTGEAGTLAMPALVRTDDAPVAPLDVDARVGEGLRATLHRSPRPTLIMAYFPGLDLLRRQEPGGGAPERLQAHRRFLDALIGEAAAALGPDDLLLVIGDAGGRSAYDCAGLVDGGVVLAAGTALVPATRLERPRVADVWPTIAWWLGMPPAADWGGAPWTDLRPDHPTVDPIPTYGRPARAGGLDMAAAALRLRQLREAGYLH